MKYFIIGLSFGMLLGIYLIVIDINKTVDLIWESQILTEKMVHNIVEYRHLQ